jgi:predicted phage terminase large subunit-like protein
MQRLNVKDISGLILDSDEDWVHLMIPMRFDDRRKCVTVVLPRDRVDEFGNELPEEEQIPWEDPREVRGELMWEERFPEYAVKRMEVRLGPQMAAGRLQQMPVAEGGAILKRDWWQHWGDEEAMRYGLEWDDRKGMRKEYPDFELKIASLDTAFGEKEENDYSALTVWGVWIDRNKNPRVMLIDGWAKRLPLHGRNVERIPGEAKINYEQRKKESWGLVEHVATTCKRIGVTRILIENKTRGVDVANEIQRLYSRENWGIELINPVKDKVTRAHSVVPLFANGVVWAPTALKWADDIITQCELFPKDEHDDYVDTVTQAISWLRNIGILVRSEEVEAGIEEEAQYMPPKESVAEIYGV